MLTDFDLSPSTATVAGEHSFYPGVTYRRRLTYDRPASIRVEDTLTAADFRSHDYVLHWHLAPYKRVSTSAPGSFLVETDHPGGPTMTIAVTGTDSPTCEIIIGDDDPYQGWYFDGFLQREEAAVIACSQVATDAGFTTQIVLQPAAL